MGLYVALLNRESVGHAVCLGVLSAGGYGFRIWIYSDYAAEAELRCRDGQDPLSVRVTSRRPQRPDRREVYDRETREDRRNREEDGETGCDREYCKPPRINPRRFE